MNDFYSVNNFFTVFVIICRDQIGLFWSDLSNHVRNNSPHTLTQYTPTITEGDGSTSPPTRHVIGHIPDPSLGPILIPAAPPYSHSQSNGIESEQGSSGQFPAQISSVHNL